MPNFIIDPPLTVYLLLLGIVLGLGYWWYTGPYVRQRAIALGVGAVILLTVFFLDLFIESAREEAVRKIKVMAEASREDKFDELFQHVSEDFRYQNSATKSDLRNLAEGAAQSQIWEGAKVWDFDRSNVWEEDEQTIRIGFLVQAINTGVPPYYCEATFKLESDGERRLVSFLCYNALQRTNQPPMTIPGLG